MTTLTWLLLGAALLLVPAADPVRARVRALAARRSASPPVEPARPRRRSIPIGSRSAWVPGAWIVVVLAVLVLAGVILAVAAGIAAATVGYLVRAARRRQARVARAAGLLAALRLLAAELEAGSRPADALAAAADVSPAHREALSTAATVAADGGDAEDVLAGTADLVPLAHAWRLAAATGAPLADVVQRVAGDLAARSEQARAVGAALAGARSSAALLALLPLLGVALGVAMRADPVGVLLSSRAGHGLCLAGVVLDAAGLLWTHRLGVRAEAL